MSLQKVSNVMSTFYTTVGLTYYGYRYAKDFYRKVTNSDGTALGVAKSYLAKLEEQQVMIQKAIDELQKELTKDKRDDLVELFEKQERLLNKINLLKKDIKQIRQEEFEYENAKERGYEKSRKEWYEEENKRRVKKDEERAAKAEEYDKKKKSGNTSLREDISMLLSELSGPGRGK